MTTDRPLLLCYDGSDDAKHAIEEAAAAFGERPAIVLVVWQAAAVIPSTAWAAASLPNLDELFAAARDAAMRMSEEGVKVAAAAGLAAEPVVAEANGPVWATIVKTADKRDARVIVAGSRGLTGLKSVLVGSVSSGIVHHANRPAFIVRRSGA